MIEFQLFKFYYQRSDHKLRYVITRQQKVFLFALLKIGPPKMSD